MKLFIVHSVYHLVYAISIIEKRNDDKYTVVLAGSNDNEVFKPFYEYLDAKLSHDIKVIRFNGIMNDTPKGYEKCNELLDKIKRIGANELYIFNEDNLLSTGIARYFFNKGAKVILGQDALKPYAIVIYKAWKYKLLRLFHTNLFAHKFGLPFSLIPLSFSYGQSNFVTDLVLSNPEVITCDKPTTKAKLSEKLLQELGDYFIPNFLTDEGLTMNNPISFFTSSLLKFEPNSLKIEMNILFEIQKLYPHHKLFLKLHPRASEDLISKFGDISSWTVINNTLPAEIYFSNCNVVNSFSAYSGTALYTDKNEVNHIWLYPLYVNVLPSLERMRLVIPNDRIKVVNRIEDILILENEV